MDDLVRLSVDDRYRISITIDDIDYFILREESKRVFADWYVCFEGIGDRVDDRNCISGCVIDVYLFTDEDASCRCYADRNGLCDLIIIDIDDSHIITVTIDDIEEFADEDRGLWRFPDGEIFEDFITGSGKNRDRIGRWMVEKYTITSHRHVFGGCPSLTQYNLIES